MRARGGANQMQARGGQSNAGQGGTNQMRAAGPSQVQWVVGKLVH